MDKDTKTQDVLLKVTKLFGSRAEWFLYDEILGSLLYPLPIYAYTLLYSLL